MSNQACVSRCAELRNEYFDTHIEWHKENTKLEKTLKHQKRAAVVGGPQDAHVRVQNTRDKLDSLQRSKPVKPVPCHYCMRNSEKKKPVVNKDPVVYQKKLADTITAQNIEHGTRFYILNHKAPFLRKRLACNIYLDTCNHHNGMYSMPRMIISTSAQKISTWMDALKVELGTLHIPIVSAKSVEKLMICEENEYRIIVATYDVIEQRFSQCLANGDDQSAAIPHFPFNSSHNMIVVDDADQICIRDDFSGGGHQLLARTSSKRLLMTSPMKAPGAEYMRNLCVLGDIPLIDNVDLQLIENWKNVTTDTQKNALKTFCESCILTPSPAFEHPLAAAYKNVDDNKAGSKLVPIPTTNVDRYPYHLDQIRHGIAKEMQRELIENRQGSLTHYRDFVAALTESDSKSSDDESPPSSPQPPNQGRILLINNSVETRAYLIKRSGTQLTPAFSNALQKLPAGSEIFVNMAIGAPGEKFCGFEGFHFESDKIDNNAIENSSIYQQFDNWLETVYENNYPKLLCEGYTKDDYDYIIHVEYFTTTTVFLEIDCVPTPMSASSSRKYFVDTRKFPLPRDINAGIAEKGRHQEFLVTIRPQGLDNILPQALCALDDRKIETCQKFAEWISKVIDPANSNLVQEVLGRRWDTHIHVQTPSPNDGSRSPRPDDDIGGHSLNPYNPERGTVPYEITSYI